MAVWKKQAQAKGDGEGFERPPAGNHLAVLVAMIDMGTQRQEYQGTESWVPRIYFCWELVAEKMSGTKDRNHVIGIDLTNSLHVKAKLRQWIEARKGKKMPDGMTYEIDKELGQPSLLSVVLNKNGYPVVNGMGAVPRGQTVPPPSRHPFLWSLDDDYKKAGKIELPDWLPSLFGSSLADHIASCRELNPAGKKPAIRPPAEADMVAVADDEEEIPF